MCKRNGHRRAMMLILALTLLFASLPVGYGEDANVTEEAPAPAAEVTVAEPEPVKEPEPTATPTPEPTKEPEPTAAPTPEPTKEPEPAKEEAPAAEPEPAKEAEPAPAESTVVTELEHADNVQIEETASAAEDAEEDFEDEDFEADFEDELVEFDDEDAGAVSEDLLQQFNNPDNFEQVEFTGSADIELANAGQMFTEGWNGKVTMTAKVSEASLSYRLVWEANDHDERGWFTVGSGNEYSYILTRENAQREANREYRVVMFAVD